MRVVSRVVAHLVSLVDDAANELERRAVRPGVALAKVLGHERAGDEKRGFYTHLAERIEHLRSRFFRHPGAVEGEHHFGRGPAFLEVGKLGGIDPLRVREVIVRIHVSELGTVGGSGLSSSSLPTLPVPGDLERGALSGRKHGRVVGP
jgi:hypothetical protein